MMWCLQVMKSYPKTDEIRKRIKRSATGALETVVAKKPKGSAETESVITVATAVPPLPSGTVVTEQGVDTTEQFIMERMCPQLAADLVILAMVRLNR